MSTAPPPGVRPVTGITRPTTGDGAVAELGKLLPKVHAMHGSIMDVHGLLTSARMDTPWRAVLTRVSAAASHFASAQDMVDSPSVPHLAVAPVRLCNDANVLALLLRTKLEPEQEQEEAELMTAGLESLHGNTAAIGTRVDAFNDMVEDLAEGFKAMVDNAALQAVGHAAAADDDDAGSGDEAMP